MSAYTVLWAKTTPESPAGFLLRMAGYEITLPCRKKVEQNAKFRTTVYEAALYRISHSGYTENDMRAVMEAMLVFEKKED